MKTITRIIDELRDAIGALDPSRVPASDAPALVDVLAEAERLCQAGRALLTGRVLETRAWRDKGFRNPAQWLAASTQGRVSDAIDAIETAELLRDLPATREAFVSGRLSETQASQIAGTAAVVPDAEQELLARAAGDTMAGLRERCEELRAAASACEDATERIRRKRYFRHWRDADGMVRINGLFPPEDGASVVARVTAGAARFQEDARRRGVRERAEAYAADALVALARGNLEAKAVVHVRVDQAALERGRVAPGEVCRIEGIGPVPARTAQRFAAEGFVKALATKEADVTAVAHLGRSIPAKLRTALEERDRRCAVPGCDVTRNLEIDHIVPFALGGRTSLANLVRLCDRHHAMKTYGGWRLGGRPGAWTWTRPERDPPPARAP